MDTNTARARSLVTNAMKEGRDMTAAELREFEQLTGGTGIVPAVTATMPTPGTAQSPELWRDTKTGAILRSYAGGERIEGARSGYGRYLRALITGDDSELDDVERRATLTGSNTGTYMVPDGFSQAWLSDATAVAAVSKAGARTITVPDAQGDQLSIARVTAPPSTGWYNQAGSISASEPTIGQHVLTFYKCAVFTQVSREVMLDSPNAADLLETTLTNALAVELDAVALEGTGVAPEPCGVYNKSGVGSVAMDTNGAPPTNGSSGVGGPGKLSDTVKLVYEANYVPSGIISSPRQFFLFHNLKDTTYQPLAFGAGNDELPWIMTTSCSNTQTKGSSGAAGSVYVGDWSKLAFVVRQNAEVYVSRDFALQNDTISILATLRADVLIEDPAAFAMLIGVTAS